MAIDRLAQLAEYDAGCPVVTNGAEPPPEIECTGIPRVDHSDEAAVAASEGFPRVLQSRGRVVEQGASVVRELAL